MAGEVFGSRLLQVGDIGDDVQELQIRLSGFKNSGVPDGEYGPKTKISVMAFQKDFMGIQPTGIADRQTFDATDTFADQFNFNTIGGYNNWTTKGKLRCPCDDTPEVGCQVPNNGFGHDDNDGVYRAGKPAVEAFHSKEYLGIHRSLLWAVRGVLFYLDRYTWTINSGYRCRNDNVRSGRSSTNHMGKAIDIDPGGAEECDACRTEIVRVMNSQVGWGNVNKKSLEPSRIAPTWVHFDVRNFGQDYLTSEFFATDEDSLNNKVTHTVTDNITEEDEEPYIELAKEINTKQEERQYNTQVAPPTSVPASKCASLSQQTRVEEKQDAATSDTSPYPTIDEVSSDLKDAVWEDMAQGIYNYVTSTKYYKTEAKTNGTIIFPPPPAAPTVVTSEEISASVHYNSYSLLLELLKNTTHTGLPTGAIRNMFIAINTWLNTPPATLSLNTDMVKSTTLFTNLVAILPPSPLEVIVGDVTQRTGLHGFVNFPTVLAEGVNCENEINSTVFPNDVIKQKKLFWEIFNKYLRAALNSNIIPPVPTMGLGLGPYTGTTTVTLSYEERSATDLAQDIALPWTIAIPAITIPAIAVLDYNIIKNSSTGQFEKSTESIPNPDGDLFVYNSNGTAVVTSADLNSLLQLSAAASLEPEVPTSVSANFGLDEEQDDYVGGFDINANLQDVSAFSESVSSNSIINTLINEEDADMNVTITITINAPVVKAEYNPRPKTKPADVVKRY